MSTSTGTHLAGIRYRLRVTFEPPAETAGERVRRQRKRLGLDVRTLADRAQVAVATISRIEAGAPPREETLRKIAAALAAPVEWLRSGTHPE